MMINNPSDSELITQLKQGSRSAFEVVYNRYWTSVYRLACKIVEDDEVAKDVVQEAFISLYENATKKDILNVAAYLFQSVKFQCFMHLRSGKISEKHLARINQVVSCNSVEEDFDAQEMEAMLDASIAELPEKCREVFYLSRFNSLSNKKIAEKLNISPKTVENQITKALKTLRLSVDKLMLVFVPLFF
jgi:RNA polymerase sigma-70 factor (family 1)